MLRGHCKPQRFDALRQCFTYTLPMPLNKTTRLQMLMTCHLHFTPFALFEVHLTQALIVKVGGGGGSGSIRIAQCAGWGLAPSHPTGYNLPTAGKNRVVGAAHCPQSLSGTSQPLQQHQVLAWMTARLAEGGIARGGWGEGEKEGMIRRTLICSSGHSIWATLAPILTEMFSALVCLKMTGSPIIHASFFHLHFGGFVRDLTN